MKKACSLILAIYYLSFTVGATLHQHYCMGELVDTSLFKSTDKACGKCGMEKHTEESKDCCKDVTLVIKSGDSHTFSQPVYNLNSFSHTIPENPFTIVRNEQASNNTAYGAYSPPLLEYPLFIQHQNFRI